jgi:uncharacterized protein YprB with RNaseH-like and TPR domain
MGNDSLHSRLDALKHHIEPATQQRAGSKVPARYQRMAETLGGVLVDHSAGSFCLVRTLYPFGYVFGDSALEEFAGEVSVPLSSFAADEIEGSARLGDLVFFDTETTGLGGAGAVAFLIGCGRLTAEGFEIRQYVLPDYSDEVGMLESALEEFGDERALVTYNGLAFDVNLVRDRLIVNRVGRDIPHAAHIDLLHSARRLFRRRLGDCSLGNVEREVFGFHREDDIPGYLIPNVYFEWLSSEDLTQMTSVLEHNRRDILALYFLLLKVAGVFATEGLELDSVEDIYSLSRVYGRRRRIDRVVSLYERLDQEAAPAAVSAEVLLYHATAFKRGGNWSRAVDIWRRLGDMSAPEAFWANLELAKYFEHREKAPETAYQHAQEAQRLCPSGGKQRDDLRRRLSRLRSKLEHRR